MKTSSQVTEDEFMTVPMSLGSFVHVAPSVLMVYSLRHLPDETSIEPALNAHCQVVQPYRARSPPGREKTRV